MFTAAKQFNARLEVLRSMVALDASCDNTFGLPKRGKAKLVEGIRSSLSVLPVAYFEDFLRTLAFQYIDAINCKNPRINWHRLPESLRKAHLTETVSMTRKKMLPGEQFNAYEARVLPDLHLTMTKVVSPFVTPTAYLLAADAFIETNSNPDAVTVTTMFNKLGCKNIFGQNVVVSDMAVFDAVLNNENAIRRQLDNIVQRRHSVAHGRAVSGMTRQEIEAGMQYLEALSKTLQKAILDTYRSL